MTITARVINLLLTIEQTEKCPEDSILDLPAMSTAIIQGLIVQDPATSFLNLSKRGEEMLEDFRRGHRLEVYTANALNSISKSRQLWSRDTFQREVIHELLQREWAVVDNETQNLVITPLGTEKLKTLRRLAEAVAE